jgi:O-antigen biosynthesis protein
LKRGIIYWDEDVRSPEGYYHSPHYKPEFNLTYLLSWNYVGDNFCVDSETVWEYMARYENEPEEIFPFSILLYAVLKNHRILHIPHVLTSRQEPIFHNNESQIYCKIIADYLEKYPVNAKVLPGLSEDTFHIKFEVNKEPSVEIVIPFKDQADQLWRCVESIYQNNTCSNYRVRLIDNDSTEDSTRQILEKILNTFPQTSIEAYHEDFNFSRINNSAVSGSSADYILFLNSDTEVINAGWLENLVAEAEAPDVAAVGACLLYPDETIQHAGVIIGLGGVAEHAHKHYDAGEKGYFNKLICSQEVMACTAACLLVNRELFILAGGFDEEHLPINFNDVDLCLRLREKGYKIIYSPHARLYHHESLTRGRHQDKAAYELARKEAQYIKTRWKASIRKGDPNYPLFFSYADGSFSLR